MASRRLPGKGLADICGRSLLAFLIERLKEARRAGVIVVATTTLEADDAVEDTARSAGIPVVRGEDDDVLSRYMRVLDAHPGEVVVRVTADNPLTDPGLFDAMVNMLADQQLDYVHAPEAPYGAAVDIFSLAALRQCHKDGKSAREREHINAHIIDNPGAFRIGVYEPPPELRRPDLRLTVDEPEDLERVRGLLSGLVDPCNVPLTEVIRIADEKSA